MKIFHRERAAILLLYLFPTLLSAADLRVEWDRVPRSMVAGRMVDVDVTGGFRLKGRALAVSTDGIQMEIVDVVRPLDSTREGKYRRGAAKVEKADILSIHVHKNRVRGRIMGVVIGGTTAAAISSVRVVTSDGGRDIGPGLTATSAALVAAGYLLGWISDRDGVKSVYIVPPRR